MTSDKSKQTVDRLVESMLELVRRKGIEGANVRAITRGADVTEATLYRYFADKKTMFHEVWQRQAHAFIDGSRGSLLDFKEKESWQVIEDYIHETYKQYDLNPAGFSYAVLSSATRKWRSEDPQYQKQKQQLIDFFEYISKQGSFSPLSTEMARRIFISTVLFIPQSVESGQIDGPAQQYESTIVMATQRMLGLRQADE
jgi:AcrR family transcriptional regulator